MRQVTPLASASLLPLLALLLLGLAACAPKGNAAYMNPCTSLTAEAREKNDLDAKVKATEKQAREFRKQGDTASAASAERRLVAMQESQRLMKESLEQSSRDCSPTWQDPAPVRDPASRDITPR